MEYIYTVMLLNKAGKEVNEANVSAVLKAAGVEADAAKVKSLIAALDGVDIEKVIEENAVVSAAPTAGAPASSDDGASAKEEKKEEKKDEVPAADAAAGLGSLF